MNSNSKDENELNYHPKMKTKTEIIVSKDEDGAYLNSSTVPSLRKHQNEKTYMTPYDSNRRPIPKKTNSKIQISKNNTLGGCEFPKCC